MDVIDMAEKTNDWCAHLQQWWAGVAPPSLTPTAPMAGDAAPAAGPPDSTPKCHFLEMPLELVYSITSDYLGINSRNNVYRTCKTMNLLLQPSVDDDRALVYAVRTGTVSECIVEWAQRKTPNISEVGIVARLPLDLADVLLSSGVDINEKDREGYTPLHIAILKENTCMVERLLKCYDIDVNARASLTGYTPLHCAAYTGSLSIIHSLHTTTSTLAYMRYLQNEMVQRNINHRYKGDPLTYSMPRHRKQMESSLVRELGEGAAIFRAAEGAAATSVMSMLNSVDQSGGTALHVANRRNSRPCVIALRDLGLVRSRDNLLRMPGSYRNIADQNVFRTVFPCFDYLLSHLGVITREYNLTRLYMHYKSQTPSLQMALKCSVLMAELYPVWMDLHNNRIGPYNPPRIREELWTLLSIVGNLSVVTGNPNIITRALNLAGEMLQSETFEGPLMDKYQFYTDEIRRVVKAGESLPIFSFVNHRDCCLLREILENDRLLDVEGLSAVMGDLCKCQHAQVLSLHNMYRVIESFVVEQRHKSKWLLRFLESKSIQT